MAAAIEERRIGIRPGRRVRLKGCSAVAEGPSGCYAWKGDLKCAGDGEGAGEAILLAGAVLTPRSSDMSGDRISASRMRISFRSAAISSVLRRCSIISCSSCECTLGCEGELRAVGVPGASAAVSKPE